MYSDIVCVYHGNCIDGATSAAIILQAFETDNVKLIPIDYNYSDTLIEKIIEHSNNKTVYLLDFQLPTGTIIELTKTARRVIHIDHKDKEDEQMFYIKNLTNNYDYFHSTKYNTAYLLFIYLNKKYANNDDIIERINRKHIKKFLLAVRDRDLWLWLYPQSEAVTDYISMFINDIDKMRKIIFYGNFNKIYKYGLQINKYKYNMIEHIIKNVKPIIVNIDGYKIPIFNFNMFHSEALSILNEKYNSPVGAFWFNEDTVFIRFVTNPNDAVYAKELVNILGSNGSHIHASTATLSFRDFFELIVSEDVLSSREET